MKAIVVFEDEHAGIELIKINDHKIQFGGVEGDGYCYKHQSFDCEGNLTEEEKQALKELK